MPGDIDLPNLVSHLEVNLGDTSGIVAEAARQGSSVGAALGESMRERVERAVDGIDPITLTATSTDLDRDLDRVRRELRELSGTRIGVDISVADALRRMDELEPHLERLERSHPEIDVRAQVAAARAGLADITSAARRLDGDDVRLDVHADTARPAAGLGGLRRAADSVADALRGITPALGSLGKIGALAGAGIPAVAGLVATLEQIAPAAAIGVSAMAAIGSATAAVQLGTSGIGDALDAAFAPATGGGAASAGRAASAIQGAQEQIARAKEQLVRTTEDAAERTAQADRAIQDAEQSLADARTEAARATEDALAGVAQAERQVAQAQRSSLEAAQALAAAREQAAEDLEDLASRVKHGKLDEERDVLAVQTAEENLAKVRADPKATDAQRAAAQLAYDEAILALEDQQRENRRLAEQQADAAKAGVEGSQAVVDAKGRVVDATQSEADAAAALQDARDQVAATEVDNQRAIADASRDVADAQHDAALAARDNARAIEDAKDAIDQARDSMSQAGAAGGGGAGGVDKFAEAMAKLSPAARAFVREVIKLKPAFDDLKRDVQEHLLAGLDTELDNTAHALLPDFRRSLEQSADSLNLMAKGVGQAARDIAEDGTLGKALDGANKGLSNLIPVPGKIVTALGVLGAAAAPEFDRLTQHLADSIGHLSDRLAASFKSGELEKSITFAVDLLGELFDIAGNVIKVITNIFAPATADGTNFLGVLADITDLLVDATAAQGFQDAMGALFGVIGEIGKVAGPLLIQIMEDLEPVLTDLGPPAEDLVAALGEALSPILDALAPLLVTAADAVGALVEAALPLLPVAGQLIAALGPALAPILDAAVRLFADLAPVVAAAARAVSLLLTPVLAVLPDLIEPIVDMVETRLSVQLELLGQILEDNAPLFAQLGLDLANLLIALLPLIELVATLATDGLMVLTPLLSDTSGAVSRLARVFSGELTSIINGLVIPTLTILSDLLHGRFGAAWDEARRHAADAIRAVILIIGGLPLAAGRALLPLAPEMGHRVADAGARMVRAIRDGIDDTLAWIGDLPDRIGRALGDLGVLLLDAGRALIQGLIDGIGDKLSDLRHALRGVTSILKGGGDGDGYLVGGGPGGAGGAIGRLSATLPRSSTLSRAYAGTAAPAPSHTTINLFGTEATPEGVSSALSWRAKVGSR